MVGKTWTIAANAFRETVRQPVFCVVLGVAGAMIALSPTFTMFTLMQSVKLVQDIGLSTILLAGLVLAVLSASAVVTEEVRGRTALMVMSRPVARWEFVLGKFLGLVLAQAVVCYLLALVLTLTVRVGVKDAAYTKLDTAVAWGEAAALALTLLVAAGANYFFDKPFPSAAIFAGLLFFSLLFFGSGLVDRGLRPVPYLSATSMDTFRACVALFPTVMVLTAAAVACATRLSLVTSVVLCSLFAVLGLLSDYLFGRMAGRVGSAVAKQGFGAARPGLGELVVWVLYRAVPNFQVFWMGDALSAEEAVPWAYVWAAWSYGALWSAALLFLAMLLFERREIQ